MRPSKEEIQSLVSCGYFNDFSKEDLDLFAFHQICGGCYYCKDAIDNEEHHKICRKSDCILKRGRWRRINTIRKWLENHHKEK